MSQNQNEQIFDANDTVRFRTAGRHRFLAWAGAVLLAVASFIAGSTSSAGTSLSSLGINLLNQRPPADIASVDYDLLWKTLKIVSSEYVDRPLDQQKLMYGAVEGMVRAIEDPYTTFLTPEQNAEFKSDLDGNFEGIGAEINLRDDKLIVVAPIPGSPAEQAGLRPQDTITAINGENALDLDVDSAVEKIRGPKGSSVILTVVRKNGTAPEDITIVRDMIHIKSVETSTRDINGVKIGIITLSQFGTETRREFVEGVDVLRSQGVRGIVLDLRNNPGGLLDVSIEVASYWLEADEAVLKEVDRNKKEFVYYSKGPGVLGAMPTVVLVNEGSASASEIVAGALKDGGKAVVVGQTSFGKGSVQDLIELDGGAAVKVTIAKWLTPSGRSINNQGVEPDISVEMTDGDYDNDRDPQMDRALDIVRSRF